MTVIHVKMNDLVKWPMLFMNATRVYITKVTTALTNTSLALLE